jgi:hypothetical protein
MFISTLETIRVHLVRPAARLIVLVPLLLTLLAACGKGTGGGPTY